MAGLGIRALLITKEAVEFDNELILFFSKIPTLKIRA